MSLSIAYYPGDPPIPVRFADPTEMTDDDAQHLMSRVWPGLERADEFWEAEAERSRAFGLDVFAGSLRHQTLGRRGVYTNLHEAGWPWRSMRGRVNDDGSVSGGVPVPDGLTPQDRAGWLRNRAPRTPAGHASWALPLWPLFVPTLANGATFGGVFFAFALALGKLRRARRRSKNACPACGYDRGGLAEDAPCPECGAAS